ncbi:MAG: 50S ribosomal protein L5 [Planctomycetota bacterium]
MKPAVVRLRNKYQNEVAPKLLEKFDLKNKNAVPRLLKVCVNMGFGKAATENNPKVGEQCVTDMTTITGQKAVVTLSRKSVSNFKLREGMQIGCRVTLRGVKMYEFLDRLFNVALPRVRDFRGISPRAFDGRGNYSLGLSEQTVFPEIEVDKVDLIHGMDVTICTNARKDEHARELLKALGCPFREH